MTVDRPTVRSIRRHGHPGHECWHPDPDFAQRGTAREELKAAWSLRIANAGMLAGQCEDAGQDLAAA